MQENTLHFLKLAENHFINSVYEVREMTAATRGNLHLTLCHSVEYDMIYCEKMTVGVL